MEVKGIRINGIYKHYKKGDYYRVSAVAAHHEKGLDSLVVIYNRCDENGIYKSIRLPDNDEVAIHQPFYRDIEDFKAVLKNGTPRFKFIKA